MSFPIFWRNGPPKVGGLVSYAYPSGSPRAARPFYLAKCPDFMDLGNRPLIFLWR